MKEIHNPIFDVVPAPKDKGPYTWSVMFKGKKYDDGIISFYGGEAYVNMPPEKFLDFDVAYLPEGFDYYVSFAPTKCMEALEGVYLRPKKKPFTMCFCFSVYRQHIEKMDINPFKVLEQFMEAAAEIGYQTEIDDEDSMDDNCFYAAPRNPVEGTLYAHFQKHVAVFEDLLQQAQREVSARVKIG